MINENNEKILAKDKVSAFISQTNSNVFTYSQFGIESIHSNAFQDYKDLETIDLNSNQIIEINPNDFLNLKKLNKLVLCNNRIVAIHPDSFNKLKNLKILDLSQNLITKLSDENFDHLENLEELYLNDNKIETVASDSFNKLKKLKTLKIFNNKFQKIDNIFNKLKKLQILKLDYNLDYKCEISDYEGYQKKLLEEFKRCRLQDKIDLIKMSPENMFDAFCYLHKNQHNLHQLLINYVETSEELKHNEIRNDFSGVIKISIQKNEDYIFKNTLLALIHLETKINADQKYICNENFIKIAADCTNIDQKILQVFEDTFEDRFEDLKLITNESLASIDLKALATKNNHQFMRFYIKHTNNDLKLHKELYEISAQYFNCFELLYKKNYTLIGNKMLLFCLDKMYMETFIFLLKRFLVSNISDQEYEIIYNNLDESLLKRLIVPKVAIKEIKEILQLYLAILDKYPKLEIFNKLFFHELLSDSSISSVLAHLLNNEKFFKIAIEAIRTKKTPHINEIIQRQHAKKFIFSNEFILPLIESTDPFTLNTKLVEYIFRRNDLNLLRRIIKKNTFLDDHFIDFELCLSIFVENDNKEIAEYFFVHLKVFFKNQLKDFYERCLDLAIKKSKIDVLIWVLDFIKDLEKNLYEKTIQKLLSHQIYDFFGFILDRDKKMLEFFKKIPNCLHLAARMCTFDKFKFFLDLCKHDLLTLDVNDMTPLDIFIQRKDEKNTLYFDNKSLKEILSSLSEFNELKLNYQTFIVLVERFDLDIINILIEKTKFTFSNEETPLKVIIETKKKQFWFDTTFIIQVQPNFFQSNLDYETLEALYQRNDQILIDSLSNKITFKTGSDGAYKEYISVLISNKNYKIAVFFFDYVFNQDEFHWKLYELIVEANDHAVRINRFDFISFSIDYLINLDQDLKYVDPIARIFLKENSFLDFLKDYTQKNDVTKLIKFTDQQNILHLAASNFETFIFLNLKYITDLKLISQIDNSGQSPVDILIKFCLSENNKPALKELLNGNQFITLNHESFIALCRFFTKDVCMQTIIKKIDFKFQNENRYEPPLSIIIKDPSTFSDYFIEKDLIKKKYYLEINLSHKVIPSLCERKNENLMKVITNEVVFNEDLSDEIMTECLDICMKNEKLADTYFNYLRRIIKDEKIINLIEKCFETAKKSHPKYAVSLLKYLRDLDKTKIKIDPIIRNVLTNECESQFTFLKIIFDTFSDLHDSILLEDNQNILHFAAQNCSHNAFLYLFKTFKRLFIVIDKNNESPLDIIIKRTIIEKDKEIFYFKESVLKELIESIAQYDYQINSKTFNVLCDRKDINLIENLISRVISDESPLDVIITKKQTIDLKSYSFFTSSSIQQIISKQSGQFKIEINLNSFVDLVNRNDLTLLKFFIERANNEIIANNENPLDILIQEMKFSNAFINQLDKKSKIFDYKINNKSIEMLCRRNNTNLFQFIFDKAIKSTSSYDILEQCIQIFIDNNNFKIAKKFVDYVKILNDLNDIKCALDKCDHQVFFDYVTKCLNLSIEKEKFKLAEYFLNQTKLVAELFCNLEKCNAFDKILKKILFAENTNFVQYLIEEKKLNSNILTFVKFADNSNVLHYVATNQQDKLFVLFFPVFKGILNQKDKNNKTPLDILIQLNKQNKFYYNTKFIKLIISQESSDFKFVLNNRTFDSLIQRKDFDLFKILLDRAGFNGFSKNKSLLDEVIQKKDKVEYFFNNLFIRKIKENSFLFNLQINYYSFIALFKRNDSDLLSFILQKVEFDPQFDKMDISMEFYHCMRVFIENDNQEIAKIFFDFIKLKSQMLKCDLMQHINMAVKLTISLGNQKLNEFILDYLKEYQCEANVLNQNLIDNDSLKSLFENKWWTSIENILNCSNLNEEKFCFSYLDYKMSSINELSTTKSWYLTISSLLNFKYVPIETIPYQSRTEKCPIVSISNHPLIWLAKSGQKNLKNHPTTLKHLELKWKYFPLILYYILTTIQFLNILIFSTVILNTLKQNKSEIELTKVNKSFITINLILFISFILFEIVEMCIDLLAYWSSLKNVLQLFTYTTSIYISIVLLSGTLCHHKEILWLSPVTLLFGYVAVLFCLEKTRGIGIYIVAFKGTILKSFYLTPIIFILFMSFIISFKASKIIC